MRTARTHDRTRPGPRPRSLVVFACLALALGACSDGVGRSGDVVGGSCVSSDDCVEDCLYDQHFPAGTCSVPCGSNDQCPEGTFCVEENNRGACLLGCASATDCRLGYQCSAQLDPTGLHEYRVCIND
jgi:hypothetical protein